LNETERGKHQAANQSRSSTSRLEDEDYEPGLDHRQERQWVAQAHHPEPKQPECRRVYEVDVSGVGILNVAVEHLASQDALGNMGVCAFISRRPEAIVIDDHEQDANEHDYDESGH
jgi:hypothetical protein